MAQHQEVANAFVQHFYQAFDSGAANLAGLYNEGSMLTCEASEFQGSQNIVNKLAGFGAMRHNIKTVEAQPTRDGVLVVVTGTIQLEGQENALIFSEIFQLYSNGSSFYIHNHIFRFNFGL